MVAVFGTNKPVVEAVRSVRASDAELLSQYGPIALVASGGGGDSLTTLDHSIVKGIINDRGGPGFSRDGNRPAPYNLQSNLAQVAAAVHTGGSQEHRLQLVRQPTPRLAKATAATAIHTVVGGTAVTFVWNAGLQPVRPHDRRQPAGRGRRRADRHPERAGAAVHGHGQPERHRRDRQPVAVHPLGRLGPGGAVPQRQADRGQVVAGLGRLADPSSPT